MTRTPADHPMDARLTAARDEIILARLSAAEAVERARRFADEQRAELAALRGSRSRQFLLRSRGSVLAPIVALTHPVRALRTVADRTTVTAGLPVIADVWHQVRHTVVPLRTLPFASRETGRPDIDDAIRWLGAVNLGGVRRHTLFAHANSAVAWQLPAAPGAAITAACGVAPPAVEGNPNGVIFEIEASSVDGRWSASTRRLLHPRISERDRRWRRLTVMVPASITADLVVRFSTLVPDGGVTDYAWGLWGEPSLVRRRGMVEVVRRAQGALRRRGLVGALALARAPLVPAHTTDYAQWRERHVPSAEALAALTVECAGWTHQPVVSVITPVHNTPAAWLRACVDSVRRQAYPHWELCLADDASTSADTLRTLEECRALDPRIKVTRLPVNGHICAASNAALDLATGEFVAFLDHDDELAPHALAEVVRRLNGDPDLDFVYSDEDKIDAAGEHVEPYFKPGWSPDQLLNYMYTNHLMVLRRSAVLAAGRFRVGFEGAQDHDLALRLVSAGARVAHVPDVLYHWRKVTGSTAVDSSAKPYATRAGRRALQSHVERTGLDAQVAEGGTPGLYRVRRRIRGTPLVSIVVPTDDRVRTVNGRTIGLVPNLVRSIVQKTRYANYEILVVDDGRVSDETRDVLETTGCRRASYTRVGPFNFAHKLNFAVRHAQGEQLLFLNDDVEVLTSDWLSAMLEYSQEEEIGAVGAKLYYPDGRLQHIGIVLGVNGVAAHAFHQAPGHSTGYYGSAVGPRNYSAVTAACMMTRRALFDRLGGFNERLAVDFNDVDYCLRLRRAGYRVVFTPYAELLHYESTSFGVRTQNPDELEFMRRTWPEVLADDPYYNPNLTRDFADYRLGN